MKYKNYVSKITDSLTTYKKGIDKLEQNYKVWQAKQKQEIAEMQGKYTPEYIREYETSINPPVLYKNTMKELRKEAEAITTYYLGLIEKQLNDYFNAPVRTEFANRIMSISVTGLALSNAEFQILQNSAHSYMELRLLNQLAESRTKQGTEVNFNPDTERPEAKEISIANPYNGIKLPNIDEIYREFSSYKASVGFMVNSYAGASAGLSEFLESKNAIKTPGYLSIAADSYFRNKKADSFSAVMEKANAVLPESKIKRELSENDKKLIDVLVSPSCHPLIAKQTVKEIAANSPELKELFLLDKRYAEYVENDAAEE
jgi:hypothetical protein